jgi:ElaB/YqjD/DUF883 family membrane-anchored ribosome-binding protein
MNTVAKASQDALVPIPRSAAEGQTYDYDRSKDKLLADLKILGADVSQLIKEATGSPGEGFAALRTGLERRLADTKAKLDSTRAVVGEKTRRAADVTHAYVKDNPWQTAGVAAAAGLLVGFLLGRR